MSLEYLTSRIRVPYRIVKHGSPPQDSKQLSPPPSALNQQECYSSSEHHYNIRRLDLSTNPSCKKSRANRNATSPSTNSITGAQSKQSSPQIPLDVHSQKLYLNNNNNNINDNTTSGIPDKPCLPLSHLQESYNFNREILWIQVLRHRAGEELANFRTDLAIEDYRTIINISSSQLRLGSKNEYFLNCATQALDAILRHYAHIDDYCSYVQSIFFFMSEFPTQVATQLCMLEKQVIKIRHDIASTKELCENIILCSIQNNNHYKLYLDASQIKFSYHHLAFAYYRMDRIDLMIQVLKLYATTFPEDPSAQVYSLEHLVYICKYILEEFELAIDYDTRLIQMNPGNSHYYLSRADSCVKYYAKMTFRETHTPATTSYDHFIIRAKRDCLKVLLMEPRHMYAQSLLHELDGITKLLTRATS